MNQEFILENKKKLETEKQRLEGLLSNFAHKGKDTNRENFKTDFPNMGDSQDDNALEVELYAVNLGEEKALESRLQKVNAALSRLQAGAYGKCVIGGEEIEEARLRVAPEAETCVAHSS